MYKPKQDRREVNQLSCFFVQYIKWHEGTGLSSPYTLDLSPLLQLLLC